MNERSSEIQPLNPYARTFFCLWGLVVLLLVGFRTGDSTYGEQLEQCVFTPYATSPQPPNQNRLAVVVQAKNGMAIIENVTDKRLSENP